MDYSNLQFKHFVDVPNAQCLIGTAMGSDKKIKLYLIINGNGPIYQRNGIRDTWDELNSDQKNTIRQLVKEALADVRIPHYSTDSLSVYN